MSDIIGVQMIDKEGIVFDPAFRLLPKDLLCVDKDNPALVAQLPDHFVQSRGCPKSGSIQLLSLCEALQCFITPTHCKVIHGPFVGFMR